MKLITTCYNLFNQRAGRTLLCAGLFGALLVAGACRKKEFMTDPEGQPIPYTDSTAGTLKAALQASPYHLYYAAWQRSHMDSLVALQGRKTQFTLFVPDDAAMQAAGLDADAINSRTPEQLDTLLQYHTVVERIDPAAVHVQPGDVFRRSMLGNSTLQENIVGSQGYPIAAPYHYRLYLDVVNDNLVVNGVTLGNATPQTLTNGVLWPINKVMQKPEKTILEALQADGRFGTYLELNRFNDSLFVELTFGLYIRGVTEQFSPELYSNVCNFVSIFAPTDEAFRNAGLTIEDLKALNNRTLPYIDFDTYLLSNQLVTDSLLDFHLWGLMYAPKQSVSTPTLLPTIFYAHDLRNELLSGYILSDPGSFYDTPPYYVPLDFSNSNGAVQVKIKGTDDVPATIVTPDINTLLGPIHAVDHLLIPKGFRLK